MLAPFSHCFKLLEASWFFSPNFLGLGSILDGLGTVLEGGWADFGKVFSTIFRIFAKNGHFVEIVVLLW